MLRFHFERIFVKLQNSLQKHISHILKDIITNNAFFFNKSITALIITRTFIVVHFKKKHLPKKNSDRCS